MKKTYRNILLAAGLLLSVACEKILDTPLQGTDIPEEEALQTKQDVLDLLQSCYDVTANVYNGRIQYLNELLSDNLERPRSSEDLTEVYNHNTLFFNSSIGSIYADPYITAFRCNRILEIIDNFNFSETEKAEVIAEAKFLRAISQWEILRLFAQPYGFTNNNGHAGIIYKTATVEEIVPRAPVGTNYNAIIADLESALPNLRPSSNYYASQDAANGFLAKIYFQAGDYANALVHANAVINSGNYSLGTSIDRFEQDTVVVSEAIFSNTSRSEFGDFRSSGFGNYRSDLPSPPEFTASLEFYNTYAADTADRRLSFFELDESGDEAQVLIKKFNQAWFNVTILHLTDLKLLRAEAIAELGGDLSVAIADVNEIRERAYGSNLNNLDPSASASQIIEAAQYERRIEMFGEGDRIQQLKRRGAIEGENTQVRGHDWNCNGMIIQFPISEQTTEFELNPTGGC
ncbi:MAG: RagB/SusD family nutrient uptake outer membrane protein [Croceimicrobium sp.]